MIINDQHWSNKATNGNRMEQQRQGPQFNWQLETWKGSTMVDRLQLSNHLLIEDGTKSPCRSISCSQWAPSWIISSAANLLLIPPSSPPRRRGNTAESCQPQGQRHSLSHTLNGGRKAHNSHCQDLKKTHNSKMEIILLSTAQQNHSQKSLMKSFATWATWEREWLRTIHSWCA